MAALLMALPPGLQAALYWNKACWQQGQWWGALSGHWLHADVGHLGWNLLALVVIGSIIEQHSRRLLLHSLVAGMLAVDLLLISGITAVERYCGLSGVINTLLFVALWLLWRQTHSKLVLVTAAAAVLKILVELQTSQSLLTDISWPPFPAAHLAGLAATPLVIWYWHRRHDFTDAKGS